MHALRPLVVVDGRVRKTHPAQVLVGAEVVTVDALLIAVQVVGHVEQGIAFQRDAIGLFAPERHGIDRCGIARHPLVGVRERVGVEVRVVHGVPHRIAIGFKVTDAR